ncbi:hypothetical protein V8C44DRAFT_352348 [Trichoderma aethiopicum]
MSLDLYDASSALLWSLVPSWSGDEVALLTAGYEMPQRLEREGGLVGRVECMDDSTRWIPLTVFFLSHTFFSYSFLMAHKKREWDRSNQEATQKQDYAVCRTQIDFSMFETTKEQRVSGHLSVGGDGGVSCRLWI